MSPAHQRTGRKALDTLRAEVEPMPFRPIRLGQFALGLDPRDLSSGYERGCRFATSHGTDGVGIDRLLVRCRALRGLAADVDEYIYGGGGTVMLGNVGQCCFGQ